MENLEQPKVTLEKASESDIPVLIKLEQNVAGLSTYSPMLDASEWKQELREGNVCLIREEGAAVGNFSYQHVSPDHIHISGLVIVPEYQGKGIGRTVLTEFLAKHRAVARIDLVTHPDNPALSLYQSFGFEIEDRKEDYFGDGEPRLVLALKHTSAPDQAASKNRIASQGIL